MKAFKVFSSTLSHAGKSTFIPQTKFANVKPASIISTPSSVTFKSTAKHNKVVSVYPGGTPSTPVQNKAASYDMKADLADCFKLAHTPVSLLTSCSPIVMEAGDNKSTNFSMELLSEIVDNVMQMESVLRKRKKKMRRHKLRKLRRRQRAEKKRLGK